MKLSIIFSTYNSPSWLEKVLWGFLNQTHREFEIIIADDGSSPETAKLINRYRPEFADQSISLTHLRQNDDGFRKCRILNKAIVLARNEYIVLTDGDCIVRQDFLSVHANRAQTSHYLSGSYYKLPMALSEAITREDIESGRCFDRSWLLENGLPRSSKKLKLTRNPRLAGWLNHLTTARCNFKGSNASAWRSDLLRVGGFDERMAWGGLDRELGVRLKNMGVKPRHVRYDAICLHLDHARGYKDPEMVSANKALRQQVDKEKITHTRYGIDQLPPPPETKDPGVIQWPDTH